MSRLKPKIAAATVAMAASLGVGAMSAAPAAALPVSCQYLLDQASHYAELAMVASSVFHNYDLAAFYDGQEYAYRHLADRVCR